MHVYLSLHTTLLHASSTSIHHLVSYQVYQIYITLFLFWIILIVDHSPSSCHHVNNYKKHWYSVPSVPNRIINKSSKHFSIVLVVTCQSKLFDGILLTFEINHVLDFSDGILVTDWHVLLLSAPIPLLLRGRFCVVRQFGSTFYRSITVK